MADLKYDVVIIGGGPAGLSAADSARQNGAKKILIIERDRELGGILQQCIHNGFGLHHFKEELTGPGYAYRCIKAIEGKAEIEAMTDTMVLSISKERIVTAMNPERGYMEIEGKTIILTMGCRERTRGAIRIPGERPAGVFTAGAAQRMVNMEGFIPGHKVVILGSGDIGLIMARRMSLEGCKVEAVLELCPFSNGLTRNMVQCLDDYDVPLYLSHTITEIKGKDRVESVVVSKVDEKFQVIPGSEFEIDCDTVLLSVGLIPENEISAALGVELNRLTNGPIVDQRRRTNIPGVYAAGNVVHVHDLVDFVSDEADIAGKFAAIEAMNGEEGENNPEVTIEATGGIRTCVPQKLRLAKTGEKARLFMRASAPARKKKLEIVCGDKVILSKFIPIAKPSEMIAVEIPAEKSKLIDGDLIVRLV